MSKIFEHRLMSAPSAGSGLAADQLTGVTWVVDGI
tara:strand:+ start:668 stop:772 length:105 start_codon:yes stop_codon:yes gene_type:complete